jgi:hypothetical protein
VPNEGNPRLILRLDPPIRSVLQARAMSRGVFLTELAKFVLVEYVKRCRLGRRSGGRLHLSFHLLEMHILRIELRPDNLNLIDCFGGVAEIAWRTKAFRAR